MSPLGFWVKRHGRPWLDDPARLVHVRFADGMSDETMLPLPASWWGIGPCAPSNWVGPTAKISEYREFEPRGYFLT